MTDELGEIEKLTEIEELASGSSQNIDRLLELSNDSDDEVRYTSIEAFENFEPSEAILSRVREGVNDENEIVRTTIIELLGNWEDVDSIEKLYLALEDESEIVRGAALTSLGQMGRKDIIGGKYPDFEGIEKVSATIALYSLGERRYLDDLLSFLDDDYYLIRCRKANSLCRFVALWMSKTKLK